MLIVKLDGISDGDIIYPGFASCVSDGQGAVRDGGNKSPRIHWENAPSDTESFVLMVVDPDVPADFGPANQPGQTIAEDAPRRNFYHWLVADIPPIISYVDAGGVPKGTIGHNSFGERSRGSSNGYDGPCPPWNDERMHHYHFIVYALGVNSLNLKPGFSGEALEKAIAGHILAQGRVVVRYTTNPQVLSVAAS